MRQSHRLWPRVLVACGAVALTIGAAEVALRLLGVRPKLPGVFSAPEEEPRAAHPVILHSRVGDVPKDPQCLRICFLGDSYAYGLSVQPQQTFVHRVGELLDERWPQECAVLNCGQVAGDVISEWVRLNHVIGAYRPDLVVHVLSSNDLDIDQPEALARIVRLVNTEPCWVSKHLRVAHLVEARVREALVRHRYLDYLRGGSDSRMQARAWRMVTREITATKKLAEQYGATYVLVRFPELLFVSDDYPLTDEHRKTGDLAGQLGVTYLDLLPSFLGKSSDEMTQQPFDPYHPSPAAHRIAAGAITDFLVGKVLPGVRAGSGSRTVSRTPDEVAAADIEHLQQVMAYDPTCQSARLWMKMIQDAPEPAASQLAATRRTEGK